MIGVPAQPMKEMPPGLVDRVASLIKDREHDLEQARELGTMVGLDPEHAVTRLGIFHGYVSVFVIAFLVTLLATPLMRKLALAHGVIDRPSEARKVHRVPVAYLGGVAVYLGLMAAILYSYFAAEVPGLVTYHPTQYLFDLAPYPVPISVLIGLTAIMLVGLLDDVVGVRPRVKVGGQLVAAAALAANDVGVKVAEGMLGPVGQALFGDPKLLFMIPLPFTLPLFGEQINAIPIDLIYWAGTAVIAVFVLGACNASNLIDGLDGLLSGVTAIVAGGLTVIALTLAVQDDGPRDASRVILSLALLGACLGFLPHNFNPASIFLGDCGSLLLGFCTIVIILTLGDRGQTHLVFAGLIIYAIPIIDTILAIVRRKMAGKRISDPDDQHLHHMLKRALGVKGAVLALYGLGAGFAGLGIALSLGRARVVYAITLVFAAFIVVTAIKIARRKKIEEQAMQYASGVARSVPANGAEAVTRPVA
ncbi:MAG: glycosyltransferase family 4 protein [Phycisphaerales bacterium]